MSKYIEKYVSGHGINFETNKRNQEAFEKATRKWREIKSSLDVSGESIIMFCGAKNNGKSNLARYILNEYNKRPSSGFSRNAYYIDFDPGQPEMTTPGAISAHIVHSDARPLQSPTYMNLLQHEPVVISSVGGINVSVDPRMYIKNCKFAFNKTKEHRDKQKEKQPIFINTMGFIRNVGLAMLIDLIKICRPTNLIVLNVESDPMRIIHADLSPSALENVRSSFYLETSAKGLNYSYDVHNLNFSFVDSTSVAAKNRTALQLAYFGTIPEALYKPVMQLNSRWLSLTSVSVYCVSSYPLKAEIVLELLYHSWIHLVKLKKLPTATQETRSKGNEQSVERPILKIIDDASENIMMGCGIICDIDLEKKRIAIITPLSQKILDHEVDCVLKPLSIQVPREMLDSR